MNYLYRELLKHVLENGERVDTRNHPVVRSVATPRFILKKTPLVTMRKTAWKKALREMEWFLSGEDRCPDELKDWWDGQLSPEGDYLLGYAHQLRYQEGHFDQIEAVVEGLWKHPNSRRNIITTWSSFDMQRITAINGNSATPTTCHGTMVQFFVVEGALCMSHYQRSADMLLGLPHNLMQYWALLLYFAHRTNLQPGWINWQLGDAHIYDHETHRGPAMKMCYQMSPEDYTGKMVYEPSIEDGVFRASDFSLTKAVPEPLITERPVLF